MQKLIYIIISILITAKLFAQTDFQTAIKTIQYLNEHNYQAISKITENKPELTKFQIYAYIQQKNYNQARKIISKLSTPQNYYWQTIIYLKNNNLQKAQNTFNSLINSIPNYCKIKFLLEQDSLLKPLTKTKYWDSLWTQIYINNPKLKQINFTIASSLLSKQTPDSTYSNPILIYLQRTLNNLPTTPPNCPIIEYPLLKNIQNLITSSNINFYQINQILFSKYLDIEALYNLSQTLYQLQNSKASVYLQTYAQLNSNNKSNLKKATLLAFDFSDYLTTLKIANLYLKQDKSDYQIWRIRGLTYLHLDMPQQAYYDLTMSLDLNPIQPELFLTIGDLAWQMKDKKTACLYWQSAYNYFKDPIAKQKLKSKCK